MEASAVNLAELRIMSLLNLENIPNSMISGVGDDILEFVTNESSNRFIVELDEQFKNELQQLDSFPTLSDEDLEELKRIETSAIPKGTQDQTNRHCKMFREFLRKKGLCVNFEIVPDSVLNDYLRLFYANLRTRDDKLYSPSSLVCVRASLQRHLTSASTDRIVNILNGDSFKRANAVLRGMVAKYLQSGQAKPKCFQSISEADLKRISQYFDRSSHKKIQEEVIFNTLYHFGMRGREHLKALEKDTFLVDTDEDGREFVTIQKVLKSKNVKASLSRREFTDVKQSRMYSSDDKDKCPVEVFKTYLQLLPDTTKDNTLFPLAIKNGFSSQAVLGKETLGKFMTSLSKNAKLHETYTNHCVRVTVVSVLKNQGYSNEEVASITGHKNLQSVQKYARHLNNASLQKISDSLDKCKSQTTPSASTASTSTIGVSSNSLLTYSDRELDQGDTDVQLDQSELITSQSEVIITKRKMEQTSGSDDANHTKIIHLHGPFNGCSFSF